MEKYNEKDVTMGLREAYYYVFGLTLWRWDILEAHNQQEGVWCQISPRPRRY